MIILRICPDAGMGNQMFAYTSGLACAVKLNTKLFLDKWNFNKLTLKSRPYFLDNFPAITEPQASLSTIFKICPREAMMNLISYSRIRRFHIIRRIMRKVITKFFHKGFCRLYSYPVKGCTEFEDIPDNSYLLGWWETEKNFASISNLVREKFKFADSCFAPELVSQVKSCNSVAIHVRRGDKLVWPGLLASNENYIRRAIEKIYSLTENPEFFVFSDDIKYCRETLPKIYPDAKYTFIEGQTPPQDMALMTICNHVIMGPSTFSWWGAWLNENPGKIIIAPDLNFWYTDPVHKLNLLPERWIKIS